MKCDMAKERMSEYLDGMLGEAERADFETHIAGCAACRGDLESLRRTVELVSGLPREKAPAGLAQRIIARAESPCISSAPAARPVMGRLYMLRAIGAAAVVVIFAAVGYKLVFKDPGEGIARAPGREIAAKDEGILELDSHLKDAAKEGRIGLALKAKELENQETEPSKEIRDKDAAPAMDDLAKKIKAEDAKPGDLGAPSAEAASRDAKSGRPEWGAEERKEKPGSDDSPERYAAPGSEARRKRAERSEPAEGRDPERKSDDKKKDSAPSESLKDAEHDGAPGAPETAEKSRSAGPGRGGSVAGRAPRLAPPAAVLMLSSRNLDADVNAVHELLEMAVNASSAGNAVLRRSAAQSLRESQDSEEGEAPEEKTQDRIAGEADDRDKAPSAPGKVTIEVRLTPSEYARFLDRLGESPEYRGRFMEERSAGAKALLARSENEKLRRAIESRAADVKAGFSKAGAAPGGRSSGAAEGGPAKPPEPAQDAGPGFAGGKPAAPPSGAPAPVPTPAPSPTPTPTPGPAAPAAPSAVQPPMAKSAQGPGAPAVAGVDHDGHGRTRAAPEGFITITIVVKTAK